MMLDPHSAVGMCVAQKLRQAGSIKGKIVLLCTASPFKFAADVLCALTGQKPDDKSAAYELAKTAGVPLPDGIAGLFDAKVLHTVSLETGDMKQAVLDRLKQI
jgi:threonine synthase